MKQPKLVIKTYPAILRLKGVKMTPGGLIDVEQETVNGWEISYNPDNERFAVHDDEGHVLAWHSELRNSRQWARTHTKN